MLKDYNSFGVIGIWESFKTDFIRQHPTVAKYCRLLIFFPQFHHLLQIYSLTFSMNFPPTLIEICFVLSILVLYRLIFNPMFSEACLRLVSSPWTSLKSLLINTMSSAKRKWFKKDQKINNFAEIVSSCLIPLLVGILPVKTSSSTLI